MRKGREASKGRWVASLGSAAAGEHTSKSLIMQSFHPQVASFCHLNHQLKLEQSLRKDREKRVFYFTPSCLITVVQIQRKL